MRLCDNNTKQRLTYITAGLQVRNVPRSRKAKSQSLQTNIFHNSNHCIKFHYIEVMPISEILNFFDKPDYKKFSSHDVVKKLSFLDEQEQAKAEFSYEKTAFLLQPTNKEDNPFDGYYGPYEICTDTNGNKTCIPSWQDITPEAVLYWENRYKECKNPLLKARYAGLVWDFKKRIVRQEYAADLYRIYVDSMLTVCDEDYAYAPIITCNILDRLFSLVQRNTEYAMRTKQVCLGFEKRHITDDNIQLWVWQIQTMLVNKKLFTGAEIQSTVDEHEARLLRFCNPNAPKLWHIKNEAEALAAYYNAQRRQADIKRVIRKFEDALLQNINGQNKLHLVSYLEDIQQMYAKFGLSQECERLLIAIQKANKELNKENDMQIYRMPITLPAKSFEWIEQSFGKGCKSEVERWKKLAYCFIPRKEKETKSMLDCAREHPLFYMISTVLINDEKGGTTKIGSIEKDHEGKLAMHITETMQLNAIILDRAIHEMRRVGALTPDKFMDLIKDSPIFEEDRLAIIREALDLYFEGKYVLFCHLIVPQIENAIRNLSALQGGAVLKNKQKDKGLQVKSLDELLREEVVVTALSEDGAYYLQLVLTDQRSLNIRNRLCHGISSPNEFEKTTADRLIHVLVFLSLSRYV